MTPADRLLLWVSSFTELRIARIRAAAKRLLAPSASTDSTGPPKYGEMRLAGNLLRLGHVEQVNSERWRTVPPTLVWGSDDRGFLCGARSETIRERLSRASGLTAELPMMQNDAPAVWLFSGNVADAKEAALATGIAFARERGGCLLASLPSLADVLASAPEGGLPDVIERWDVSARRRIDRWKPLRGAPGLDGLYRTQRPPRQYYFRDSVGAPVQRLDTRERQVAAAYRIAGERWSLRHHRSRRVLWVPAVGFGMPLLVDRGLILASGRLPVWASAGWEYDEIDFQRAADVARLLDVRMEAVS